MNIEFAEKLRFLFQPYRYKVAHGGRGSGKSWGFARALLLQGAAQRLRIACFREVQKSIRDSVHRLLSDQIEALGLSSFYEVFDTEIRGRNGTVFLFAGLSNMTTDSIKSYEGVDRAWCEEAQSISKRSWDVLIPTIRKENSEIWISFNPELDTDETYVRFVLNPPPNSCVVEVNYHDNPWFPEVLEQERQHFKATNPKEDYEQIWEGRTRSSVVGAIYASEIQEAVKNGQFCNVPYDPLLRAHTVWDLGWNDSMTISIVQRVRSEVRVIDYIEDSHKTLDWYISELRKRPFNWGYDWLPHDAKAKDFKTGKSTDELLKAAGRKTREIPNVGIENGIRSARMLFRQTYFDKTRTARLLECLKRYRRAINQTTNEPGQPIHDEFSHGADNFRYLAVIADELDNENQMAMMPNIQQFAAFDSVAGY